MHLMTWAFAISSAFKRYFAFELQSVGVMLWSIFLCQRPQKNIWSSWTFDSQSNHLQFASIPVLMRLCALESYFDPPRLISVARWLNWHAVFASNGKKYTQLMSIVKPCLSTLIYIINRYFCEIDICNHMDGSMHIAQVFLILSLRNKEWHIYEILSTCHLFTSCSVLKAFHLFTCCSLKSGQCSYFSVAGCLQCKLCIPPVTCAPAPAGLYRVSGALSGGWLAGWGPVTSPARAAKLI